MTLLLVLVIVVVVFLFCFLKAQWACCSCSSTNCRCHVKPVAHRIPLAEPIWMAPQRMWQRLKLYADGSTFNFWHKTGSKTNRHELVCVQVPDAMVDLSQSQCRRVVSCHSCGYQSAACFWLDFSCLFSMLIVSLILYRLFMKKRFTFVRIQWVKQNDAADEIFWEYSKLEQYSSTYGNITWYSLQPWWWVD